MITKRPKPIMTKKRTSVVEEAPKPKGRKKKYDCVTCGACCHNPLENQAENYVYYVEIDPTDVLLSKARKVRRLVVLDPENRPHMRMDNHRCVALQGTVGKRAICEIYEERPSSCHRFRAGSKRCKQYRKEQGVDP